jgi:hypothetical protein
MSKNTAPGIRGPDANSDRELRGDGLIGMCHDPSTKTFLPPSSLVVLPWAETASETATRLPVEDGDDGEDENDMEERVEDGRLT